MLTHHGATLQQPRWHLHCLSALMLFIYLLQNIKYIHKIKANFSTLQHNTVKKNSEVLTQLKHNASSNLLN